MSDDAVRVSEFSDASARRPIMLSQTRRPASVRRQLVSGSVRDGWIVVVINFNAAIFFGLVPLTAGYGAVESLIFLGVQTGASSVAVAILLILSMRPAGERETGARVRGQVRLLVIADTAIMVGWGGSALLFLAPDAFERNMLVILMLTTIGVITAALSSRLPESLLLGRAALFLPLIAYLMAGPLEHRELLAALASFAAATTLAVGYALHLQHLSQAALAVHLRETRDALGEALTSAERSAELARRETDMRERFMRSVTHDLRQPVGALGLHLREVARHIPEGAAGPLHAAESCVISANTVIDSVAQLALIAEGLPPPKMRPTRLAPIFEALALEAGALARHFGLRMRMARTSLAVLADHDLLERALRNLLHNALQYTQSGGVLIGAQRRACGRVLIRIVDTGPGIAEAERAAIFKAFHQAPGMPNRALGNIGLGLAIVSDFASAMGAKVEFTSVVGAGSSFGLVLERADADDTAPPVDLGGASVLVLDDDPDAAAALAGDLRALGAAPVVIEEPEEMRSLTRASLCGYDALLLDCRLGPTLTAFDILARLAEDAPTAVLVSSLVDAEMQRRAAVLRLPLLMKPVARSLLGAAVSEKLAAKRNGGAST